MTDRRHPSPAGTRSIEAIQDEFRDRDYIAGPVPRDGRLPRAGAGSPAPARGRGRGRQDGAGQGPRRGPGRPAHPAPVLRGPGRQHGRLRVELPPPDARDPAAGGARRGRTGRTRTTSSGRNSSSAGRSSRRSSRPTASRRSCSSTRSTAPTRSSRRTSWRSCPTSRSPSRRSARSGAEPAAARDPDLEPDPRGPRRPQAPLPLPLDRLSDRPEGIRDRPRPGARGARAAGTRGRRLRPSAARGGPDQGARASPRPSTGRPRSCRLAPASSPRSSSTRRSASSSSTRRTSARSAARRPAATWPRPPRAADGTTPMTDPAIVRAPFGAEVDGRRLLGEAVGFGRALRAARLSIDLGAAVDFARALTLVDIGDREQVRGAGAAIFVRRRDDRATYDAVFDRWWRRRRRVSGRLRKRHPCPPETRPADAETAGARRRRTRPARRHGRPSRRAWHPGPIGRAARTATTRPRSRAWSSRRTPTRRARSCAIASSTG